MSGHPPITHKTDLDPILLVERTPDNPTCKSKRRASNPVAIKGLAHRLVIHRPMTSLSRDATVEMSTKLDRTLNSKLHAEVWSGQGRPLSSLKASLKPLSPVKRSQGHARRQHGARNRPVVGKETTLKVQQASATQTERMSTPLKLMESDIISLLRRFQRAFGILSWWCKVQKTP